MDSGGTQHTCDTGRLGKRLWGSDPLLVRVVQPAPCGSRFGRGRAGSDHQRLTESSRPTDSFWQRRLVVLPRHRNDGSVARVSERNSFVDLQFSISGCPVQIAANQKRGLLSQGKSGGALRAAIGSFSEVGPTFGATFPLDR